MRGKVYYDQKFAGIVERNDGEYRFTYDQDYLTHAEAFPISLTLPLRNEPYRSRVLFAFFDGLIPEGWLLDIAVKNWKLSSSDRFLLLLSVCNDCIGAVRVLLDEEKI